MGLEQLPTATDHVEAKVLISSGWFFSTEP